MGLGFGAAWIKAFSGMGFGLVDWGAGDRISGVYWRRGVEWLKGSGMRRESFFFFFFFFFFGG